MTSLLARLSTARALHPLVEVVEVVEAQRSPKPEPKPEPQQKERGFAVREEFWPVIGPRAAAPESEGSKGRALGQSPSWPRAWPQPWSRPGAAGTRRFIAKIPVPCASTLARATVCLGAKQGARPVFIDTETTGLAGGGTVAFVIGAAWMTDGGSLCVRQWTLGRLSAEAAMLADLLTTLRALGPAPLVSFNGASFDVPLLRLRAQRHRLAAPEFDCEHLDLLHVARRLWQGRAPDCRLGTLEDVALGLRRRGDIPSAEIPEVYWDWLERRTRRGESSGLDVDTGLGRAQRRMAAVLEHNCADLVSLPALAEALAREIRRPCDLDRARRAARHLQRIGVEDQARTLLASWVESELADEGRGTEARGSVGGREVRATLELRDAALELATLHRRAGERERAARLWRWAWSCDPRDPQAAEAWAKHLEHYTRDYAQALRVASGSRLPCLRRLTRLRARVGEAAAAVPSEAAEVVEARAQRPGRRLPWKAPVPAPAPPRSLGASSLRAASVAPRPTRATSELLETIEEPEAGPRMRYRLHRQGR